MGEQACLGTLTKSSLAFPAEQNQFIILRVHSRDPCQRRYDSSFSLIDLVQFGELFELGED